MHVGDRSPIKHVIYIVKENRTYDQEFGSLGKGAGDPGINLFGDESAPNSRALARQFVTLDNFYADAEISAQGWNWSVAANSNPYVEQAWPANYSGRNRGYDFEDFFTTGDRPVKRIHQLRVQNATYGSWHALLFIPKAVYAGVVVPLYKTIDLAKPEG